MLKFTFNALIQQLWLRALHTAEKHHPTMFCTATVRTKRSGQNILYNTSLRWTEISQINKELVLIGDSKSNQFLSAINLYLRDKNSCINSGRSDLRQTF